MDDFDLTAERLRRELAGDAEAPATGSGFAGNNLILVDSDSNDDSDDDSSDGNSGSSEESELDEDELAFMQHHLYEWEAMESGDDYESSEFSDDTDPDNYTDHEEIDGDGEHGGTGKKAHTSGLATFQQFARLPAELRLRIWELHCPDLLEPVRVFEMHLEHGGHLVKGISVMRKSRPLRRFMRICQETRARGLQTIPDELSLGKHGPDGGVLRFNARSDILHFNFEERGAVPAAGLYENVRNIAMFDMEVRSRGPGVYHDYVHGQSVLGIMSAEDVSHQSPSELRPSEFCKALDKAFPHLENLYVVERGIVRRLDRWVGADDHEEYDINTYERDDLGRRVPIRFIYCWHAPPPKCYMSSEQAGTRADEEEAVVNHVSALKERGVRFSRMLLYEYEEGWETLLEMRTLCSGGEWPVEEDGRPRDDDPPFYGDEWIESMDEYESEGIDDEDLEPSEDSDNEEDDDLLVVDGTDSDSDSDMGKAVRTAEATFSSPEPESEPEPEAEASRRRGKRRRVLSDSDGSVSETGRAREVTQARVKRQRRMTISDDEKSQQDGQEEEKDDEDDEDNEDSDGSDDDDRSSETEAGQDVKRLSLAERLQLNRLNNPISSDEDKGGSASEDEESVGSGEYGALVQMSAEGDNEGEEGGGSEQGEGEGEGEGEWGGIEESGEEEEDYE